MIKWLKYRSALGVGILRHILPYKKLFDYAGKNHDRLYTLGEINRFECDRSFFVTMILYSEKNRHTLFAVVYFIAVRIFGGYFYNKKK